MPQFATAEYAGTPGSERCRICGAALGAEYFRVNTQMACGRCAQEAIEGQPTDSHVAFGRAVLYGLGAALLGLLIYSLFAIVTGFTIGYIALAVGWLVAKAMMKGSHGVGGLRYQVVALLLTYAAISISAVPVGISYLLKHPHHTVQQKDAQGTDSTGPASDSANAPGSAQKDEKPSAGSLLVKLILFGLASPFLNLRDPSHGIIGLVILFVGMSIAFRLTRATPLDVDGPYSMAG